MKRLQIPQLKHNRLYQVVAIIRKSRGSIGFKQTDDVARAIIELKGIYAEWAKHPYPTTPDVAMNYGYRLERKLRKLFPNQPNWTGMVL